MKTKRAYYPHTTIQQRKLLFEAWEQDKHVTRACQRAHVGRATFYYWEARYDQEGYAGLERYEKQGAPKGTGRIAEEIETKVVALRKAHTEWGKERINQEMTKANNWVANVDLLFVPSCHLADMKLPAVSGSSGHLVVERLQEAGQEKQYPGRVFLDYEEVVKAFVDASKPFDRRKKNIAEPPQTKIQLLRQEGSNDRREIRNLRILEDADWKLIWEQHRDERKSNRFGQPRPDASWGVSKQKDEERNKLRKHRRAARINWREKMDLLSVVTAWTAILLVTDNCSRQCLGLPLFVAGSHVTSEMIVAALRILLPTDLKFIISDRGSHFSSKSFTQFATEANFLHVLIARHTCTHRRCGVVRSQTGLPNVLSAQSRSGLLTKPGLVKKICRNTYASFCSNTMIAQ
jgi:transposase